MLKAPESINESANDDGNNIWATLPQLAPYGPSSSKAEGDEIFPVDSCNSPHILNSSVLEMDSLEVLGERRAHPPHWPTFENEENTPQSKSLPEENLKLKKITSLAL